MPNTAKLRGAQVKPTRAEVNAAWCRIRAAADQGSIEANALLIALTENRPVIGLDAHLSEQK